MRALQNVVPSPMKLASPEVCEKHRISSLTPVLLYQNLHFHDPRVICMMYEKQCPRGQASILSQYAVNNVDCGFFLYKPCKM